MSHLAELGCIWVKLKFLGGEFKLVRSYLERIGNPVLFVGKFELVLLVLNPVVLWGCIGVDSSKFGSWKLQW